MDNLLQRHALGFYEVKKKPTSNDLQKYYAEKYFQESRGSYAYQYTTEELESFRNKLVLRHAALANIRPEMRDCSGSKFLDVGCGEGYALAYFREQGCSVKGFDFSSAGVELKNPECISLLTTGNLFELLKSEIESGRRYNIVWLQNVLEHVIDPVDLMLSLRSLVSSAGVAVITVPNDCSVVQSEALKEGHIDRAFWVMPPDHLSYFNKQSLVNIATETGWKVADILADFPIDWFLFHSSSNYVAHSSAGENAHLARVQLENLIARQPIENVLNFWRSLANVGSGRNLTIFLTPD